MAQQNNKKTDDADKLFAALSYIPVVYFYPFIFAKHDFVKKHAKQGMRLAVIELFLLLFGWIPIFGWLLAVFGWLFVVICSILGLSHAMAGEKYEVPFIHKLMKK